MKKLFLVLMIAAVFVSCKKNDTTSVQPETEKAYAEVSFNINQIIPEASREDFPFNLPECSDTDPVTADIVIMDGEGDDATEVFNGTVSLYSLPGDENLYTQAIKLDLVGCDPESTEPCCNTFYVTEFYVKNADGVIIYAAPAAGSDAQGFLDYPERMLNREIVICEFTKYQFDIDVLCYEEAYYTEFGFVWFNVNEVVLCQVCFFGDICLNEYPWYEGDWAPMTPAFDMPAIFQVWAEKWNPDFDNGDGTFGRWEVVEAYFDDAGAPIYSNLSWLGAGEPLCVPFADYLNKEDRYRVNMNVWMPTDPQTMGWVPYYFTAELVIDDCDYSELDLDGNGVVEFVIGGCQENPENVGGQYYYNPGRELNGAIVPGSN
ncbi:MAG: hypothetical protein C0591_05655 [Marinilabiliales bacterium]|nr:MAG: hypothetical protein C0591_05655 [Marinilabiliales bacterium]